MGDRPGPSSKQNRDVLRFYGALTLSIKINVDWERDGLAEDNDLRHQLLKSLVETYLALTNLGDAAFVLQKLSSTLVAYYLKPTSAWVFPIRQLAMSFESGHLEDNHAAVEHLVSHMKWQTLSFTQLRSILWFVATLSEDVEKLRGTSLREAWFEDKNRENFSEVSMLYFHLFANIVTRSNGEAPRLFQKLNDEESESLTRTALESLPRWCELVHLSTHSKSGHVDTVVQSFRRCIGLLFEIYNVESLADDVLSCFSALLSSSNLMLDLEKLEAVITSPYADRLVSSTISGDASQGAHFYIELLVNLLEREDLLSPGYLDKSYIRRAIQVLVLLMHAEGVPNVEDESSQRILEQFSYLAEGYVDWCVGQDETEDTLWLQKCLHDICRGLLKKASFPIDELSRQGTWDADDRTKFRDFRMDAGDYLQIALVCIPEQLVALTEEALLGPAAQNDFSLFEAGLFFLDSFSESLAPSNEPMYDDLRMKLSKSTRWQSILQSPKSVPDRVVRSVIRLLEKDVEYFQRHHDDLVPTFSFLFSLLGDPFLAPPGARAIEKLCLANRKVLATAWQQFYGSLSTLSNLGAEERHRLLSAVAAVIEGIEPLQHQVEPLLQLLDLSKRGAVEHVLSQESRDATDPETIRAIDGMQSIAAIGKGLRSVDALVSLDLETGENNFWTTGSGQVVQEEAMRTCTEYLVNDSGWPHSDIISALCDFLKSGYTEQHPSPFKFAPARSSLLLLFINLSISEIETVLATTSAFLASVSPSELGLHLFEMFIDADMSIVQQLGQIMIDPTKLIVTSFESPDDNTDEGVFKSTSSTPDLSVTTAIFDHLNRLLPKWIETWLSLPKASLQLPQTLNLLLAVLTDTDTLPRRSAATLLTIFLDLSSPIHPHLSTTTNPTQISQILSSILKPFLPTITATLTNLISGECARSELDALTSPIRSLLTSQPLPARHLLHEAVKDSSGVLNATALECSTEETRERFVKVLIGLVGRGGARTKVVETVREYWISCRPGGEGRFGYTS